MDNFSDENLVQRALKGDIDSFAELCRRYYPSLQALAYSVLEDRHLAEDAAQEALAAACRRLNSLRKKEAFGVWLGSICRNIARDILHDRQRQRTLIQDCPASLSKSPELNTSGLKNAIKKLPAALKEVIYLRYAQDLTYQQIASVLGISEEAVNGRLRRGKQKLARYLSLMDKAE